MADPDNATPSRKLLLVDDDRDILSGMQAMFRDAGFDVATATDGNSALAQADRHDPDLIVLDMMLPKRSGFLILEKLKRKDAARPKVIMITGNEGTRHQTYAENLGVDDYIRKPFSMDRLLKRVQELLN